MVVEDLCRIWPMSCRGGTLQVAVVTIRGIAAFGAGEGDGGHNVGTAFGEVEENTQSRR